MGKVGDLHHLVPLVCGDRTLFYGPDSFSNWADGYQGYPVQLVDEAGVTKVLQQMATEMVTRTWIRYHRVCLISILKGGLYTQYRLLQYLPQTALFVGHIGRSSYRKQTKSSKLRVTYDLDLDPHLVQGSLVWLIDDIADTGATIKSACDAIEKYHPSEILVATLINKGWKNKNKKIDIVGFNVEHGYDPFIVGCGMGFGESYRNLSSLYEIQFEEKCI